MGTNYYWYPHGRENCPHCRREPMKHHIGKSSMGWCFALRIHPAIGIRTLADWHKMWKSGEIADEYDRPVSVTEMMDIITERQAYVNDRGTLRHAARGEGVTVGDGTYDLIDYEFS